MISNSNIFLNIFEFYHDVFVIHNKYQLDIRTRILILNRRKLFFRSIFLIDICDIKKECYPRIECLQVMQKISFFHSINGKYADHSLDSNTYLEEQSIFKKM
jgi:hypothetical protein